MTKANAGPCPPDVPGGTHSEKTPDCDLTVLRREPAAARHREQDLNSSAVQWQDIFDAIADAICILDADQNVLRCNRAMRQLLELDEEAIIGRKCIELLCATAPAAADRPCPGAGARAVPGKVAKVRQRWFETSVNPRFDAHGVLQGYIHVMSDVTSAVHKENELREAHHTLLMVLDSIEAVVFAADPQSQELVFMNRCMRDLFKEDLSATGFWKTFCSRPGSETGGGADSPEVCVWEAFHSIKNRWFLHHDRAVRWVDGRSVRLHVATDISAIKSLEQERIQNETRLRQAQKMEAIGTLAGGIAHDFNNILSAILGYAELALDDATRGHSAPAYIQQIIRAGFRARDLVHQILTFSRQTESEARPIQIQPIIKEALKLLRASLPSTIDIQISARSEALVLADPIQIHQVIMNLCTNAGHAMRQGGGVLRVGLAEEELGPAVTGQYAGMHPGRYVKLQVSDTGHGIAPAIIERIFDPYFSTKKKEEGSGMGLAVVQGIVRRCGGAITVASKPGQGATFCAYLPIACHGAPRQTAPRANVPRGCERVLFVDDEAPLAELAREMLSRLGYQVTVRTSSIQALSLFENHPDDFDLVITDYTMPHITGDLLAEKIKAIRPAVPIIICTGYSQTIDETSLDRIGVSTLLMKPLNRGNLGEVIRRVLDSR